MHSLTCTCTRHIHVDVQFAVETAHGTPDVICTVSQHYETSAFDIFDEYNILATHYVCLYVASSPGLLRGGGEGEGRPGIHCMRMRKFSIYIIYRKVSVH